MLDEGTLLSTHQYGAVLPVQGACSAQLAGRAPATADVGACHLQGLSVKKADVSGALTSLLQIVPKLFSPPSAPQQLGLQEVSFCDISARPHVLLPPPKRRPPSAAGYRTRGRLLVSASGNFARCLRLS